MSGARHEVARVPYGAHRERLDLSRALPLATPLSLLIDPANACNFKCVFCPTGDPALLESVGRPRGLMRFGLFEKIVDDLAAFPDPVKSVHLYKDGEPLLHKRLPDMVRLLKTRGVARYVEITTNGALLTPDRADALVEAGLDGVRVSVYGSNDAEYRRVTRTFADFARVLDNVRHLWRRKTERGAALHVHCKIIDPGGEGGMDEDSRRRFLAAFAPVSDSVYVHPLHGAALERDEFRTVPRRGRRVCSEPFLKLAVNVDGQVSVCCADWNWATVVGDVSAESLRDIWNGERLHAFRMMHLDGRRHEIAACRDCAYMTTLPADNDLDAVAGELAGRYEARRAGSFSGGCAFRSKDGSG